MAPGRPVLDAFGLTETPVLLAGGQGETWRSGAVVLRPSPSLAETTWKAGVVGALRPSPVFRTPLPIPTRAGGWSHDGWEAWSWLPGTAADESRLDDVLRVGAAFHDAVADVPRPAFLDDVDTPWSRADRSAWGERALPSDPLLDRLADAFAPVARPECLQHGDLLGNVLFHPVESPAVIDWAPYWRPAGSGAAIAEVDAVCWHGAFVDRLRGGDGDCAQLRVRALAFRIVALVELGAWDDDQARRHTPVVDAALDE